jgi:glycosyltransferase involved in cell wall biosynthesis
MSSTRISVVIIFLNGEAFLEEAIDSVRLQTHTNWELLLVDDGSRDSSPLIAHRAAEADPARVRYLQHSDLANHGTSASRNLGAAQAQGTYLLFLDCDDLLLPTNLARHAAVLDAHPELAAVFSPTLFWLWDRAYAADSDSIQSVGRFGDRRIPAPELLLGMLMDESLHPANCGTMFRRAIFNACGGFDESFRGMYEDTAFLTKLLMSRPTYMIGDCLSAYRAHRASQCNTARDAGEYDSAGPSLSRFNFLRWAKEYALENTPPDSPIVRAVDRELLSYQHGQRAVSGSRLASLARRAGRRLSRLWGARRPDNSIHAVLAVMGDIHSTYIAMHRDHEAAAITARIAELQMR